MLMIRHLFLIPFALCLLQRWSGNSYLFCKAWVSVPVVSSAGRRAVFTQPRRTPILFSTPATEGGDKEKEESKTTTAVEKEPDISSSTAAAATEERETSAESNDEDEGDDEDEEDEYEYIEYETLTEPDYLNSEWAVGTRFDSNTNKIDETWVRLVAKDDKNIAIWGDGAEGKWSLDVASQFFSISKEYLWGKRIWAGVVDDYYFVQGTVRGWSYVTPASVIGQWQAKRLGVDPEEAGTPPWFEVEDEEDVGSEKAEEPSAENSSED